VIAPGGRFRPNWLWTSRPRRLSYTWRPLPRRRNRPAPSPAAPYTEDMLFDQPPQELPVATMRARGRTALAAQLRGWFAAKWTWLRPRSVPVAVAFAGMLAVLASVNALTHFAQKTAEPAAITAVAPSALDDAQALRLLYTGEAPQPQIVFAALPSGTVRFIPLCSR
jgi:hypothetical protein